MNLPNRLTLSRVLLVPVYLLVFFWGFPFHYLCSVAVFAAAALTDLFDGKIARKRGLVTNFGKFVDPIADKMLTTAAFIGLMAVGAMSPWALLLVLTREFAVASVRMLAAEKGVIIAAGFWGKFKTVAQFIAILFAGAVLELSTWSQWLTPQWAWWPGLISVLLIVVQIAIWISTAFTVLSGVDYLWSNRRCFLDGDM